MNRPSPWRRQGLHRHWTNSAGSARPRRKLTTTVALGSCQRGARAGGPPAAGAGGRRPRAAPARRWPRSGAGRRGRTRPDPGGSGRRWSLAAGIELVHHAPATRHIAVAAAPRAAQSPDAYQRSPYLERSCPARPSHSFSAAGVQRAGRSARHALRHGHAGGWGASQLRPAWAAPAAKVRAMRQSSALHGRKIILVMQQGLANRRLGTKAIT